MNPPLSTSPTPTMHVLSTRGRTPPTPIDIALAQGLAPDGGLYVPAWIPRSAPTRPMPDLASTARHLLAPYFAGSRLAPKLDALCAHAFAAPAPLRRLNDDRDHLLELFHGPTAAFKDYAARFLAVALEGLRRDTDADTRIIVATSGDTGAAVAAAFHQRPGFAVTILYPDGRVSPRQAHGLGCWGGNVQAFRVDGSFDDCQHLAKQALGDPSLRERLNLTSANSISLGRLLPQAVYHAHAATRFHAQHGRRLNLIVPTGNLGNALAAWLARRMGAPLGDIHLASNANDTLARYFAGASYEPQPTRATLANAMDVGAPSNFERLRHWHRSDAVLRAAMRVRPVDDATIRTVISSAPARHGVLPCPHTATGLHVLDTLRAAGDRRDWAVVATAHPAKFDTIVEPLVGRPVPVPPALAASLQRPARAEPLATDYAALRDALLGCRPSVRD